MHEYWDKEITNQWEDAAVSIMRLLDSKGWTLSDTCDTRGRSIPYAEDVTDLATHLCSLFGNLTEWQRERRDRLLREVGEIDRMIAGGGEE